MEKAFNISNLFGDAWDLFKKNWKLALMVGAIMLVLSVVLAQFGYNVDKTTGLPGGSWIVSVVGILISIVLTVGVIDIFVGLARGETKTITRLVTSGGVMTYVSYILASLVYGIMAGVGFILLIIPGLILMAMFLPYTYIVVDQNMGPIAALKEAKRITKGHVVDILLLLLCIGVIYIIGAVTVIGALVTLPFAYFVLAVMYIRLTKHASGDMNETEEEVIEVEEVEEVVEVEEK